MQVSYPNLAPQQVARDGCLPALQSLPLLRIYNCCRHPAYRNIGAHSQKGLARWAHCCIGLLHREARDCSSEAGALGARCGGVLCQGRQLGHVDRLAQAEVAQLHVPARVQQQVVRLDVPARATHVFPSLISEMLQGLMSRSVRLPMSLPGC